MGLGFIPVSFPEPSLRVLLALTRNSEGSGPSLLQTLSSLRPSLRSPDLIVGL